MSRSQSYKAKTNVHWLSQLLDGAAFPALLLAVAVSQVNIGHHKAGALRQPHQQSDEVQADKVPGQGADKYGARPATESPRFEEKSGPGKRTNP
ncbi:MAG: hypothetical protein JO025_04185 [Verrucomicrobia bacterium]|nr:hypothetical protein [Verrucomicrobiota bacterium]